MKAQECTKDFAQVQLAFFSSSSGLLTAVWFLSLPIAAIPVGIFEDVGFVVCSEQNWES